MNIPWPEPMFTLGQRVRARGGAVSGFITEITRTARDPNIMDVMGGRDAYGVFETHYRIMFNVDNPSGIPRVETLGFSERELEVDL